MNRPRSIGIGLVSAVLVLVASSNGKTGAAGPSGPPAAQAPALSWTEAAPAPNRYWSGSTFVPTTCEIVAYGGDDYVTGGSSSLPRNTLIYQPAKNQWLSIPPQKGSGPPWMTHPALTFDAARGVVVMFGGGSGSTYAFTPATRAWSTIVSASSCSTSTCPSARRWHAQAWSSVLQGVVVYGGWGSGNATTGDLWVLRTVRNRNGSVGWKWSLLEPAADGTFGAPGPRNRHGMAELPGSGGKLLIYGGWDSRGNALSDTWLYDPAANRYTALPNAGSPPQRQGFAMGVAPPLNAVIVQGGQINSSSGYEVYTQETWMFDQGTMSWAKLYVNEPGGNRSYHDISTDTCSRTAVIFDKPAIVPGTFPTWILKQP